MLRALIKKRIIGKGGIGASLAVQWPRLHAPDTGGQGRSLVQGSLEGSTRAPLLEVQGPWSHMPQEDLEQPNKYDFFKNEKEERTEDPA